MEMGMQVAALVVNCSLLWWVARRMVERFDEVAKTVQGHTIMFAATNVQLIHIQERIEDVGGRVGNLEELAIMRDR